MSRPILLCPNIQIALKPRYINFSKQRRHIKHRVLPLNPRQANNERNKREHDSNDNDVTLDDTSNAKKTPT